MGTGPLFDSTLSDQLQLTPLLPRPLIVEAVLVEPSEVEVAPVRALAIPGRIIIAARIAAAITRRLLPSQLRPLRFMMVPPNALIDVVRCIGRSSSGPEGQYPRTLPR